MNWPEELIAAHELGHAIVGRETGLTPGEIRLEASWWSDEITGGYCKMKGFRYPTPDNSVPGGWSLYRGMLVMTAGGQAASEHWFTLNDQPIEDTTGGADGDYAIFHQEAPVMPDAPTWAQALEEARHIVVSHWDEVVALIPALLEKRKMAGSRIG